MKKRFGRFLVGLMVAAMVIAGTGCGQDAGAAKRTGSNTKSVKDILDAQTSSESDASLDAKTEEGSGEKSAEASSREATADSNPAKDASTEGSAETGSSSGDGKVSVSSGEGQTSASSDDGASGEFVPDVDLTTLSSTMVYSEVYNMMTAPSDYIGKNVKMKGNFSYYQDPNTGND